MVDMTFSELKNVEKLRQAACLVEEVAYARAGMLSKEKIAHLIFIAASLERLAAAGPILAEVSNYP